MAGHPVHDDDDHEPRAEAGTQRLDKWLWFVRVVKSRTQAAGLVTEGKVRINRDRTTKPSQSVKPGDVITVTVRGHVRILRVVAPGERRGPASEAAGLFVDMTPPKKPTDHQSEPAVPSRSPGSGRPTKRERRQIDRLREP